MLAKDLQESGLFNVTQDAEAKTVNIETSSLQKNIQLNKGCF